MGPPESCSAGAVQATQLPALGENDVHVYFVRTSSKEVRQVFPEFWSWSTPEERVRYSRYRFEQDRSAFLLGRGLLRSLLGRYAGWSPGRIVFRENAYGKPVVDDLSDLSFNVSHCHDLVCVAMSANFEVGVDVELALPQRAELDIAEQYFTAEECAYIRAHAQAERHAAFFRLWTLKEAYIKCLGMGLSIPLDSFQFRVSEREIVIEYLSSVSRPNGRYQWQFRSWQAWRYCIALALRSISGRLSVAEVSTFQVRSNLLLTLRRDALASES